MDYLKHQILTEVIYQDVTNTSKTPDIHSSLKYQIQTFVSEINFLRGELQEKNTLVKSLVTLHMLHENVHVPYKNDETNPYISPSCNVTDTTKFCSSTQVSNSDDVIDFSFKLLYSPGN